MKLSPAAMIEPVRSPGGKLAALCFVAARFLAGREITLQRSHRAGERRNEFWPLPLPSNAAPYQISEKSLMKRQNPHRRCLSFHFQEQGWSTPLQAQEPTLFISPEDSRSSITMDGSRAATSSAHIAVDKRHLDKPRQSPLWEAQVLRGVIKLELQQSTGNLGKFAGIFAT